MGIRSSWSVELEGQMVGHHGPARRSKSLLRSHLCRHLQTRNPYMDIVYRYMA